MKPSTSTTATISGDLPIRSANSMSATTEMAQPPLVDVQDATNEQIRDAVDLARMNRTLNFSDALAITVGKKRARRRRPKSKRGNVIITFKISFPEAYLCFCYRASLLALKNTLPTVLSPRVSTPRCLRSSIRK